MIRYKIKNRIGLVINDSVEGELIETKIERVVHNNEPIKDGAPIIYTERKEGIRPSTNIRTDRFEVALEATEKIEKSYKARRENKPEVKKEEGEDKVVKDKSTQSEKGEGKGEKL